MNPRLPEEFLTRPIAHRALHDVADGRPENSRSAIAAAIAAGYGIEIDLQLSADRRAMVFHDYDLDRLTTASGAVRLRTQDELQATPLRGGSEGIPSFREVLAQVKGQVPLLVELKDQDGAMGENTGALEAAVAEVIKGYSGPLALMSFNPHTVAQLALVAPDVPRGLTTCAYETSDWPLSSEVCAHLRQIPDYQRVGACFISHDQRDLSRARVAELKAGGADILCWTVKTPEMEAEARKIAQNITFEGYRASFPG